MHRLFKKMHFVFTGGLILAASLVLTSHSSAGSTGETLLIFTQDLQNPVESHFNEKLLPEIKGIAAELGVETVLVHGAEKLPEGVGITPLLIFQNHLGRSVYQGRTTTLKRIGNFLRTSRRVPQGKIGFQLKDIPIWRTGRSFVWSPLKISSVSGAIPDNYNDAAFQKEALKAIKKGFQKYHIEKTISAGRNDRGFYMDFYPWVAKDGTLYLSLALFSQFHCKKPVFTHKLTGKWKKRHRLFKQAARLMEAEVGKRISELYGGDGFVPVPEKKPVISWNNLGFSLPPAPAAKSQTVSKAFSLPLSWEITNKKNDSEPGIQFRFPPPLDAYSGEVKTFSGALNFSKGHMFTSMRGFLKTDTFSITMGEADLDSTIKGSLFLESETYPVSEFIITNVSATMQKPGFGQLSIVNLNGIFKMKGKEQQMSVPATIEPVIGENGNPELIVSGSFSIDLRNFEIEGATGPEPQKYTLLFDLNLIFSPAPEG